MVNQGLMMVFEVLVDGGEEGVGEIAVFDEVGLLS